MFHILDAEEACLSLLNKCNVQVSCQVHGIWMRPSAYHAKHLWYTHLWYAEPIYMDVITVMICLFFISRIKLSPTSTTVIWLGIKKMKFRLEIIPLLCQYSLFYNSLFYQSWCKIYESKTRNQTLILRDTVSTIR